jgi:hypothetical protein
MFPPEVVEWILMVDDPDVEMSWVGVTAREKMSVGWACGMVWVWRYCFDMVAGELMFPTFELFYAVLRCWVINVWFH